MKIIVTEDKIVTLNNVKEIEFCHTGSGAKSNPHRYYIFITYFGNEKSRIDFDDDENKAKETFKYIAEILAKQS